MLEHTHHVTIKSRSGQLLSISLTVSSEDDLGLGVVEELLTILSSLVTDLLQKADFTIQHSAKVGPSPSRN